MTISWTPLSQRLVSRPPVLAGPILRQVLPDKVTVWFALKEAATVAIDVYEADPTTGAAIDDPILSGSRIATHLGPNLYMTAVSAVPTDTTVLTSGRIYVYDVRVTTNVPIPFDTAIGGTGAASLAYAPFSWPSFALPPSSVDDLRLFQGSCRKPNAEGWEALEILDELIDASADDPVTRPHQLLFTGDQIYSDEVADVLLWLLTDAAGTLMGLETLPHDDGGESLPSELWPTTRSDFIKSAGLTTPDTRSHLMSLGEYLAMYLFVWSDVLWPPELPTYADLEELIVAPPARKALAKLIKSVTGNRNNVQRFRLSLPKVRKVLANIPSYMIFDDHEITDDWNLLKEFAETVYQRTLGRRIVQNGLLAYALCQHWGNAPEQFDPARGGAGSQLLTMLHGASGYQAIAHLPEVAQILGIHYPAAHATRTPYAVYHDEGIRTNVSNGFWVDTASLRYHYTIESPTHQIIVTDTRTWRSFPRQGSLTPCDHISESVVSTHLGATPALDGRTLFVVVSTNLLPSPAIRQGARDLAPTGPSMAREDFYESWEIERADFARFTAALSHKFPVNAAGYRDGRAIVLSGDVHTSSASRLQYWANWQYEDSANQPNPALLVIAHLIASALHNQSDKTLGQHDRGYLYTPSGAEEMAQSIVLTEGFVGWSKYIIPPFAPVGRISVESVVASGEEPWRFDPAKAIYTLRDQEILNVLDRRILEIQVAPHFRYLLEYQMISDGGRVGLQAPPLPPGNPVERQAAIQRAFENYALQMGGAEGLVGRSNIGEVNVVTGGAPAVSYLVRWQEANETLWVRFDISLNPADRDPPRHPTEGPP